MAISLHVTRCSCMHCFLAIDQHYLEKCCAKLCPKLLSSNEFTGKSWRKAVRWRAHKNVGHMFSLTFIQSPLPHLRIYSVRSNLIGTLFLGISQ